MALKIISGLARGIMLDTPSDRSMRPTSGRAREALFSSLGSVEGKRFADIFAGSGAIGLEAASRGAAEVTLLEANAMHVKLIERNIAKLRKAGTVCNITAVKRKAIAGTLLALASKLLFVKTDETVEKITAALPGANCGGCGFSYSCFPSSYAGLRLPVSCLRREYK